MNFNKFKKEEVKVNKEVAASVELDDIELEEDDIELDEEDTADEVELNETDDNYQIEGQLSLIPEEPKKEFNVHKAEKPKKEEKKAKDVKVKSTKPEGTGAKKKTKEEELEEKIATFKKIVVKVFGRVEYEFDTPDDIKMIKLDDLKNRLITERNYGEFTDGVNWSVTPGRDKSIGYLVPTYKFHPKG